MTSKRKKNGDHFRVSSDSHSPAVDALALPRSDSIITSGSRATIGRPEGGATGATPNGYRIDFDDSDDEVINTNLVSIKTYKCYVTLYYILLCYKHRQVVMICLQTVPGNNHKDSMKSSVNSFVVVGEEDEVTLGKSPIIYKDQLIGDQKPQNQIKENDELRAR